MADIGLEGLVGVGHTAEVIGQVTPQTKLVSRLREGLPNATTIQDCAVYTQEGRSTSWKPMDRFYVDTALDQQPGNFTNERFGAIAQKQLATGNTLVLAVRLSEKTEFADGEGAVQIVQSNPACWINAKKFLTVDEAKAHSFGGSNAFKYASDYVARGPGEVERIVQASNGYFYPCGKDDVSVNI